MTLHGLRCSGLSNSKLGLATGFRSLGFGVMVLKGGVRGLEGYGLGIMEKQMKRIMVNIAGVFMRLYIGYNFPGPKWSPILLF